MQINKTTAYIIFIIFLAIPLAMGTYIYNLKADCEEGERSLNETIQSLRIHLYSAERARDSIRTVCYELYNKVHPPRGLGDFFRKSSTPDANPSNEKPKQTVYAFAEITVMSVEPPYKSESYVSNVFEMSGASNDIIARMRDHAENKINYKTLSTDKLFTTINHYSSYQEASQERHSIIIKNSSTNTFDMGIYY